MVFLGWLLVVAGLVIAALGVDWPDRVKAPWDGLVAFLAPVGVACALVGVLLICVPDFFRPVSQESGAVYDSEIHSPNPGESQ